MRDRVPPHNIEAEMSVLGAVLLSKDAFYEVHEHLKEDDFYNNMHREIFKVMLELYKREEPIDVLTVSEELKRKKALDMVGGRSYITTLSNYVPSTSNVGQYAKIVAEKSTMRKLIDTASEIMEESFSENKDVGHILDDAEKRIFDITQGRQSKDFTSISDVIKENDALMRKHAESGSNLLGLATGLKDVDNKLCGLQNSDLIIVAARPSMGKTSFALNLALGACDEADANVLIFSLEMSKEQLGQRLLSMDGNIELSKIRDGSLLHSGTDIKAYENALKSISGKGIYVDDSSNLSPMEIKNKARRLKAEKGLDLIIIDYLQLMTLGTRVENRQQEITSITRMLKQLAKEMDCPLILLSQLSRAVEQRPGKNRPMLSDLRESGAIEQDADIVMFLYRDDYYNKDTETPNICDVIIAKNRNGEIGDIRVTWISRYTKFANYSGIDDNEYISSYNDTNIEDLPF